MTAKKLERMLKKTPGINKLFTVLWGSLSIGGLIAGIGLIKQNQSPFIGIAVLIVFFALLISLLVMLAKSRKGVRSNGRKTIEYLRENNLFDAAAREYDSEQYYAFKCSEKDGRFDKFYTRTNFMTENFVFAMSSNRIVTYTDIEETYIVRYKWYYDDVRYVNDVFTAKTICDDEIDLFNMFLKSSALSQRERSKDEIHTMNTIAAIIREKNPDCSISTLITEERIR